MKIPHFSLAFIPMLAACGDGQPLNLPNADPVEEDPAAIVEPTEASGSDPESNAIPATIDEILNLGTLAADLGAEREARGDVGRTEGRDGTGGITTAFSLNAEDDTFLVDNLAFDGLNVYQRGSSDAATALANIGDISVFSADEVVEDFLTNEPVLQAAPYIALFDSSDVLIGEDGEVLVPRTAVTVIRSGAYTGFGFGGFGYERAGEVVLAQTGQASFTGDYAGLRVYSEEARLELIEGKIAIQIDFDDFDETQGVAGQVTERQAFNADGIPLPTFNGINRFDIDLADYPESEFPLTVFDEPTDENPRAYVSSDVIQLPDLPFVVRAFGESIDDQGQISGEVRNRYVEPVSGATVTYEEGFYFGVIAGDTTSAADGGEIAGIIRTESPDSRFRGVTAQETGVFIADR